MYMFTDNRVDSGYHIKGLSQSDAALNHGMD